MQTLRFEDMLTLIADRSTVLQAAAEQAGFTTQVPSCPDWTAHDLIAHLGEVQLFWAATVAAGPAEGPPDEAAVGDTKPHGDLITWSADATAKLLDALREAGPGRSCWTWWESAGAPNDSGAVARHQVQEAAVHAYDAQLAAGAPEALPAPIAADGVSEFLHVELPTNGPWPYEPATVVLETGAGGGWVIDLGPLGARSLPGDQHGSVKPTAVVTADPSDMVLAFYRRPTLGQLHIDGDAELVPQLLNWPGLD